MNADTIQQLLDINKTFYESFGAAFAATRTRIQPGVRAFLATVPDGTDWLDLGCGSGALGVAWAERNLRGSYSGRDFSVTLLNEARALTAGLSTPDFTLDYDYIDLLDPDWADDYEEERYDGIVSFAALHHIPSRAAQAATFRNTAKLLKPGGEAVFSVWQFHNSPKLVARILPWDVVGLNDTDVEPGDTLLDWRFNLPGAGDERGLRYVHLFQEDELRTLAEDAGLRVTRSYLSDGKSGNLALYQHYRKPN